MRKRIVSISAAAVCGIGAGLVSTGAAQATAPGDGSGVITVNSAGSTLTSLNPDGSGLRTWNIGGVAVSDLVYSPDGARIAYVGPPVDASHHLHATLWIANADGSDAHSVAYSGGVPEWSRDGRYLYFSQPSLVDGKSGHEIMRIAPNGSGLTPTGAAVTGTITAISAAPNGDLAFSYAPALNFGSGFPLTAESVSIWHAATGKITPVADSGTAPDYSPDGSTLAFVSLTPPAPGQTFVTSAAVATVSASGGNPTTLYATDSRAVAWSPDGTRIAFSANKKVYILDPTTSSVSPTDVASVGDVYRMAWQPKAAAPAAAATPTVDRLGGADRIATAVDASRFEFQAVGSAAAGSERAATVAVLTRSDAFADALGGSALAGEKHGPLLLTPTSSLDPSVRDELRRVLPPGATVYLLGGTSALSPVVEQQVRDAGFTPKRLSGADRYATNLAIDAEITTHPRTLLVATGENYPDALAAGAVAASRTDAVVVLSHDGTLPAATEGYITAAMNAAPPTATQAQQPHLIEVGNQAVEAYTAAYGAGPASWYGRVDVAAGGDRFATAAALQTQFEPGHRTIALATGMNWADALAGGAIAGANDAPLVLSEGDGIAASELTQLRTYGDFNPSEILVFGGTGAVPQGAVNVLMAASGKSGWALEDDRLAPPLP